METRKYLCGEENMCRLYTDESDTQSLVERFFQIGAKGAVMEIQTREKIDGDWTPTETKKIPLPPTIVIGRKRSKHFFGAQNYGNWVSLHVGGEPVKSVWIDCTSRWDADATNQMGRLGAVRIEENTAAINKAVEKFRSRCEAKAVVIRGR